MTGQDKILKRLKDILDQEKKALLVGILDHVERLSKEKTDLLAELENLGQGRSEKFSEIHKKSKENSRLLRSAALGIQFTMERLSNAKKARDHVEFYDKEGRRRELPMRSPLLLEKKL